MLGEQLGWEWNGDGPERARSTPVAGPILLRDGECFFPAPADAVIHQPEGAKRAALMPLRPLRLSAGAGGNLPDSRLAPMEVCEDVKRAGGYNYWAEGRLMEWLRNPAGQGFGLPEKIE